MTITVDRSPHPSVFDAGLPHLDYENAQHPDEAHDIIRRTRMQAPIALGPHGPELLSYDLVRTALRDPRFQVPQGMFLAAQGITAGPIWDRVATNLLCLDGAEHHRLRRLICKAFTPRATARLRTTISDIINELVDRYSPEGRCEVVTDIARQYPIPIICALLGAPPEDWELFSDWTDDIFKVFSWNAANEAPAILAAWEELDAYIDDMVAHRRHALTDDLISELIRAEDDGDRLSPDELRMLAAGLLMAAPTPPETNSPHRCTSCASTPTSGPCWPSIPSWHPKPSRRPCAIRRSSSGPCAPPSKMSNSPGSSSPPAH